MPDTVTISVQLLCRVNEEEKGLWSAGCPRLDVYSQGGTREDAKGALKEAIELFIESCLERDTLDEVLRDSGFRLLLSGVEASESSEHIAVERRPADEDDNLLGEEFPLNVEIPAYQAALLLERNDRLDAR